MSKRKSLDDTLAIAARAKTQALLGSNPAAVSPAAQAKRTSSFNIPPETMELLQACAFARAKGGGRVSISAFLVEFIEQHRAELVEFAAKRKNLQP
jgi:hypothetical protein